MTSVRISRLAEADLDEIWTYLSTVSIEAADELILRIYSTGQADRHPAANGAREVQSVP